MTPTRDEVVACFEYEAKEAEKHAARSHAEAYDAIFAAQYAETAAVYRLALALLEQGRLDTTDAARWRAVRKDGRVMVVERSIGVESPDIFGDIREVTLFGGQVADIYADEYADALIRAARTPATPLRDTPVSPRMGTEKPPETAR